MAADETLKEILPVMFDPNVMPKRMNQAAGADIVATSAVNFYEGVTQKEVEAFYNAKKDPNDTTPISYGLNSKVVKENGQVTEQVWKLGGMYDHRTDHRLAGEGGSGSREQPTEGDYPRAHQLLPDG